MKIVNGFKYKPNSHSFLEIFSLNLRLIDTKYLVMTQPAITCSKLTIKGLEQGVKLCSELTI